MTEQEIADGFKKDPSTLEKVADWIRRHLYVAFGKHGEYSAEAGVKFEF